MWWCVGQGGNGGLSSYYGYNSNNNNYDSQSKYLGGGNVGYGYYDPLVIDRNVRPQYVPSGYRGYN